jgi:hypothetical protein
VFRNNGTENSEARESPKRKNTTKIHILKQVIEGKMGGTRRRGIIRKQLLDDVKVNKGYWNLKEEELDRALLIACFGRSCGPVARQNM